MYTLKLRPIHRALCITLLVMFALFVATSPVLAYLYRATFTVAESNGTDYTALPVTCSEDVEWLVDNGFITTSTALDTRVETFGGTEQIHMMAEDRIMAFVPSLDGNSQLNWYLTTGNSALSSFPVIVGDGGYVTISDAAALELEDDFKIEFDGYLDMASDEDLIEKEDAFRLYKSSGDLKLITYYSSDTTVDLVPDGVGDYTNIALQFPDSGFHWEKVDDPPSSPDGDTTSVRTSSATQEKDAYNLEYDSVLGSCETVINSVTVYFRFKSGSDGYKVCCQPFLRLGGSETAGTELDTTSTSYVTYSETLSRPGGGSWSSSDIQDLQVAVGLRENASGSPHSYLTQIYVKVNYTPILAELTASGVSSGEPTVEVWADGTNLGIDVGGVTEDTALLLGGSVDDNSNDWVISNLPYFNYYEHTVSDALVVDYEPIAMISSTTLPDKEGTAQNGAITWGSNPAGVTVTLGSLTAESAGVTIEDEGEGYRETMHEAEVGDWFLEPDVGVMLASHPLRPLVTIMSDGTTVTEVQAWRFLGLALLLLVTVGAAVSVHGHLLIAGLACGGTVALLAQQTIWPGWTLVFIIPAVIAGLIAERTPSI